MNEDKKLKGRDLINIGIYGAIYFVILFAVAMLGMIPIFLPLLSVCVTGTYLLTHSRFVNFDELLYEYEYN